MLTSTTDHVWVAPTDKAVVVLTDTDTTISIYHDPNDCTVNRRRSTLNHTDEIEHFTAQYLEAISQAISSGLVDPNELIADLLAHGYRAPYPAIINGELKTIRL